MTTMINLYGRPGVGKSTIMYALHTVLIDQGFKVEILEEPWKIYVNTGDTYCLNDQLWCLGIWSRCLHSKLNIKPSIIITDCPVLQQKYYDKTFKNSTIYETIYNNFDNINIFLKSNRQFELDGRCQTSYKDCYDIEDQLFNFLRTYISFHEVYNDASARKIALSIYNAIIEKEDNK